MKFRYTGNYVHENGDVIICFTIAVGGGPARFHTLAVPARSLDSQEVHDAMAAAALALMEHHYSPPWEEDALPLWG